MCVHVCVCIHTWYKYILQESIGQTLLEQLTNCSRCNCMIQFWYLSNNKHSTFTINLQPLPLAIVSETIPKCFYNLKIAHACMYPSECTLIQQFKLFTMRANGLYNVICTNDLWVSSLRCFARAFTAAFTFCCFVGLYALSFLFTK